jgi:CBS domain-containing protein
MPFNTLDQEALNKLARHCRIDFFPKGTQVFKTGETEVKDLYIIQSGGVKTFIVDDEGEVTLKDYRGQGSVFGALGLIRGTRANLDVEMVEDTFCFLVPGKVFLDLIKEQPGFAQYYLKTFSNQVVSTAYTELRRHKWTRRGEEDLYLFTKHAGELIKTMRKVPVTFTIQDAAAAMTTHKVGSLLIHTQGDSEEIIGIITDKDLRSKVLAKGLDYSIKVGAIMSSPVQTVESQAICFEVLLRMMSTNIHHLGVEQSGRIIGVITSRQYHQDDRSIE